MLRATIGSESIRGAARPRRPARRPPRDPRAGLRALSLALALTASGLLARPASGQTVPLTPLPEAPPAAAGARQGGISPRSEALTRPEPQTGPGAAGDPAADPFYGLRRAPGWTYRLRLWNALGRAYALRGLPPPLPADLRAAAGGGLGEPVPVTLERADTLDVLLLGSDRRSGDGPWRTDTIVLASLDRHTGRAGLVSIPRDLWVSIPGHGPGRINTADWLGSQRGLPEGQLIRETLALNMGLEVDHFVRVDLRGFVAVVDALGGLDLAVACPLEDFFYDPKHLGGQQALDLDTGLHHMDGETALRYVRSRWQSSDFSRARRQQQVLRAALSRAREAGLLRRAPELWSALSPYLATDIQALDVPGLALLAARHAERLQLRSAVLSHPATIDWVTPDGAMVLLLDPGRAAQVLDEVLREPAEIAPELDPTTRAIELFDATGREGWGAVAAAQLEEAGLRVTGLDTLPPGPQSLLFHAPEAEAAARAASAALGLPAPLPDTAWPGPRPSQSPLWAHLGDDWRACR